MEPENNDLSPHEESTPRESAGLSHLTNFRLPELMLVKVKVTAAAINKTEQRIFIGYENGWLFSWYIQEPKVFHFHGCVHNQAIMTIQCIENRGHLITGGLDHCVYYHDTGDIEKERTFELVKLLEYQSRNPKSYGKSLVMEPFKKIHLATHAMHVTSILNTGTMLISMSASGEIYTYTYPKCSVETLRKKVYPKKIGTTSIMAWITTGTYLFPINDSNHRLIVGDVTGKIHILQRYQRKGMILEEDVKETKPSNDVNVNEKHDVLYDYQRGEKQYIHVAEYQIDTRPITALFPKNIDDMTSKKEKKKHQKTKGKEEDDDDDKDKKTKIKKSIKEGKKGAQASFCTITNSGKLMIFDCSSRSLQLEYSSDYSECNVQAGCIMGNNVLGFGNRLVYLSISRDGNYSMGKELKTGGDTGKGRQKRNKESFALPDISEENEQRNEMSPYKTDCYFLSHTSNPDIDLKMIERSGTIVAVIPLKISTHIVTHMGRKYKIREGVLIVRTKSVEFWVRNGKEPINNKDLDLKRLLMKKEQKQEAKQGIYNRDDREEYQGGLRKCKTSTKQLNTNLYDSTRSDRMKRHKFYFKDDIIDSSSAAFCTLKQLGVIDSKKPNNFVPTIRSGTLIVGKVGVEAPKAPKNKKVKEIFRNFNINNCNNYDTEYLGERNKFETESTHKVSKRHSRWGSEVPGNFIDSYGFVPESVLYGGK